MSRLIIIPTPISEDSLHDITPYTMSTVSDIRHFVVENLRTARRVLRKYGYKADFDSEVHFIEYDKHAENQSFAAVENWFKEGHDVGLLSEAGLPCIADPGSEVVRSAHRFNLPIEVLSGPSSIILALVASGLNGQSFSFNGYLPIELSDRIKKIKYMESLVLKEGQTQLFMETPYRNQGLFELVLKTCSHNIFFSVAADIGGQKSFLRTKRIAEWVNGEIPMIHKLPTIFSLGL